MAQKPDGKAAKTERVTFTRPAAERIAKVVRHVEAGDRKSAALVFGSRISSGGDGEKVFRMCTFTGAWAVDSYKTVTFRNTTTTPNTVSAMNVFVGLATSASDPRPCAIAKDGTAWYLIAAACD